MNLLQPIQQDKIFFGSIPLSQPQDISGCNVHKFENQTFYLAINGKIHNLEELRETLEVSDNSDTDTVVLHSILKWGAEAPRYLEGEYSFVFWDPKKHTLLSARDHFGSIPLLYWYSPERHFIFASNIEQLLSHPDFPKEKDHYRIADYLAGDIGISLDNERTFYKYAKRLPSGMSLSLHRDSMKLQRYWHLTPYQNSQLPLSQAAEQFRELLTNSITKRTEGFKRIGVPLSGGLDSGSIFSILRTQRDDLSPVTLLDAEKNAYWEIEGISEQLKDWRGKHKTVLPEHCTSSFTKLFDTMQSSNELFDTEGSAFFYALLEHMVNEDQEIVLGGMDGDLIASSNPFILADLLRAGDLSTAWNELPSLSKYYELSSIKMLLQFGVLPLAQSLYQSAYYLRKLFRRTTDNSLDLLSPELIKDSEILERISAQKKSELQQRTAYDVQRAAILSPTIQTTREKHYRLAHAFGLNITHPFLDPKLVEFTLNLPNNYKFRSGSEKHILREAMKGILPEKVRTQRSHGGGVAWHYQYQFLKRFEGEILSELNENRDLLEEWINTDALTKITEKWSKSPSEESVDPIIRCYQVLKFLS